MATTGSTRQRLQVAAVEGLLAHGPQVSVEAIAAIAGVGRRTAFRHFATRDELLAAGIEWVIDGYVAQMPRRDDRPVETWLRALARASADHVSAPGPAYVALIVAEWESEAMKNVMERRAAVRRAFSEQVALEAWRASGRSGRPPQRLVDTCLLCLGPFAHYALRIDGASDTLRAGRAAGEILVDVLRATTASPAPSKAACKPERKRTLGSTGLGRK